MTLSSRHVSLRGLLRAAVLPAALTAGLLALVAAPRAVEALPVGDLWVSEVMYNPTGWNDDGSEWVELFNAGSTDIDLSSYSLGWGGADYTTGVVQLLGTIPAGQYFVVGGPPPATSEMATLSSTTRSRTSPPISRTACGSPVASRSSTWSRPA